MLWCCLRVGNHKKLYDSYQGKWLWGKEIKVSPNLEAVLKKMVAFKPSERYQNAEQVLRDLKSNTTTNSTIGTSNPGTSTKVTSTPTKSVNSNLSKIHTAVVSPGYKAAGAVATNFIIKLKL